MINGLLVFAVFFACMGAFKCAPDGSIEFNTTALALLASTALTSELAWREVPFSLTLWLLIDIAVIAAIVAAAVWRRRLPRTDWAVLALFAPSWYFYAFPGPQGPQISTLAVSAQLLVTFPAASVWKRTKRARERRPDIFNEFDLRAAHGQPGG